MADSDTNAGIDIATFRELQATAGADFVAELVQTFAEEGPRMVEALRAAHEAGAADSLRRHAHSLKSNGQTFGAVRLAARAREHEVSDPAGGGAAAHVAIDALAQELQHTLATLQRLARG